MAEVTQNPEKQKSDKREKAWRDLQYFCLRIAILLSLLFCLFYFVIGITFMPNEDMTPRLDDGDMLLYFRLNREYRVRDIICFHRDEGTYVARIVAGPSDIVDIREDRLCVNDRIILESKIYEATPQYEGGIAFPIELGAGEYFVLGDRREHAADSRVWGPVRQEQIDGVVITVLRRNNL